MKINKFPRRIFLDKRVLVNGLKQKPAYINYENHTELSDWIQYLIDEKHLNIPCCGGSDYILKEDFLAKMDNENNINFNPIFEIIYDIDLFANTRTIPPINENQSGLLNLNVTGSSDGNFVGGIYTRDYSYTIGGPSSILELKDFSIGKHIDSQPISVSSDIYLGIGFINNDIFNQIKYPEVPPMFSYKNYSLFIEINKIYTGSPISEFDLDIKISQIVDGIKTSSLSSKINLHTSYDFKLLIEQGIAKLYINNMFRHSLELEEELLTIPMSICITNISQTNFYDIFLDALYYDKQK